jgi:hypothetical protein
LHSLIDSFVPQHPRRRPRRRKAACEKIRAYVSLQNMHLLDKTLV